MTSARVSGTIGELSVARFLNWTEDLSGLKAPRVGFRSLLWSQYREDNSFHIRGLEVDDGETTRTVKAVRLNSWKEIARYMGKGVRTVQRWEKDFGLPVQRGGDRHRNSVYVWSTSLDAWVVSSCEIRSDGSVTALLKIDSIRKRAAGSEGHRRTDNPSQFGAGGILTSWKEIALYVGSGVRTVQRWEQDFGFPVRRPKNLAKNAVLALSCDIDRWLSAAPISGTVSFAA